MPTSSERCGHLKRDGTPCPNPVRPGRSACWVHDPELAGRRAEGRRAGGVSRSRPARTLAEDAPALPLKTVADVVAALGETYNLVRVGTIDVRVGNCLGVLAGTLLKALQGEDYEKRLRALESQQTGGQRW